MVGGCVKDVDGAGIADVVVSDGINVTLTDANGNYELETEGRRGYIFVSTPGGYRPAMDGNRPVFWLPVNENDNGGRGYDFVLQPMAGGRQALLVTTDRHLTGRNNDIAQYERFVTDINGVADSLRQTGYNVTGIDLGDLTWDQYWGVADINPITVAAREQSCNMPLYHLMGNHDNDPYHNGDREAECTFEKAFGPIYYSFNLGDTHVVVIDDIIYDGAGASADKMGNRKFHIEYLPEMMEWVKRDLATVKDKDTPLVVALHAPLYNVDQTLRGATYRSNGSRQLEELLKDFSNVRVVSGHSHVINNTPLKFGNGMEHNVAAVSGSLWMTDGLSGINICRDGSPAGYLVCKIDGDRFERVYYKGTGEDENYQMRAYDLNKMSIDLETIHKDQYLKKFEQYNYTPVEENEVLINVFNYDPSWAIGVWENGMELPVKRIVTYDPLHVEAFTVAQNKAGKKTSKGSVSAPTSHMFVAKAMTPDADVHIVAVDGYGHRYELTLKR